MRGIRDDAVRQIDIELNAIREARAVAQEQVALATASAQACEAQMQEVRRSLSELSEYAFLTTRRPQPH